MNKLQNLQPLPRDLRGGDIPKRIITESFNNAEKFMSQNWFWMLDMENDGRGGSLKSIWLLRKYYNFQFKLKWDPSEFKINHSTKTLYALKGRLMALAPWLCLQLRVCLSLCVCVFNFLFVCLFLFVLCLSLFVLLSEFLSLSHRNCVWLCVYLSLFFSRCEFVCVFLSLSLSPCVCVSDSVCLCVLCLPLSVPVYLSVYLNESVSVFVCLCVWICVFVCVFFPLSQWMCVSVCLCLSLCLSVFVSLSDSVCFVCVFFSLSLNVHLYLTVSLPLSVSICVCFVSESQCLRIFFSLSPCLCVWLCLSLRFLSGVGIKRKTRDLNVRHTQVNFVRIECETHTSKCHIIIFSPSLKQNPSLKRWFHILFDFQTSTALLGAH